MHKHREEQEQTSSSNPQELRFSAGDKVTLGDKSGKVYWIIRQSLAVQLLRWATAINWQHRFNWLRGVQSKQFSITRCERFKAQSSFDMACGCNSALLLVSVLSRGREGKSDKHLMPSTQCGQELLASAHTPAHTHAWLACNGIVIVSGRYICAGGSQTNSFVWHADLCSCSCRCHRKPN